MHIPATLLAEIGIDDTEIAQRKAFLSLNEQDQALLKSMHGMLEAQREKLTEVFYDHLLRFPEIRPLLGDESKLARLKNAQMNYFSQLSEGCYEQSYVENRLHIGVIHQRIGLTPKWYMSAYCKYLNEVTPLIMAHYANEPDRGVNVCQALTKVIFFDMGLALDTYFHTERKELLQARSYTEQIVNNMPIGFIVLNVHGQIKLVNNAVLNMFGLNNDESWRNQSLGEYLNLAMLDIKINQIINSGKHCIDFDFEHYINGKKRAFLADISAAHSGDDQVILFMVQDITLRKQSEDEVHRLAFYDPLTQLPNRRLLQERLMQSMSISARSGKYGALMFIDMDNFKTINDTQGHDVGDLLLKVVASRLSHNVREGDTVARLGGDEFVIALESLSTSSLEAANRSESVAEKIRAELNLPYRLNGIEHHSSPSIGVCLFRGHQNSLDEILKQADLAMYQAKSSGRNTVCFFDPVMQQKMEYRAELEKDLRSSLRLNQLKLYYQMQVDESGRIVGAEALIRWLHPKRGLVSPVEFIPLAEEIGMILPIGDWVIEQACAQLKAWEMNPAMRKLQLSVNVSPRQLSQPYFVEQITEAITNSGIRASQLKLELTESFILKDVDEAIEKMHELRWLGIRFALDDFGTGYSSLAYLNRLPLEQLKIDRSFINDIADNQKNRMMARTIINIANNFGLKVVAEGVESDEQLAFLRQYGCNLYQGYLFGKPIPADEFDRLFESSLTE